MEAWTTIRHLRAQGKGIKSIARELGISRNTVRLALKREGPPRYQRGPRPKPQLDAYRDLIQEMKGQEAGTLHPSHGPSGPVGGCCRGPFPGTPAGGTGTFGSTGSGRAGLYAHGAHRANLFFQLVSHRYERGSIIITTNKPFDQWGQVYGGDDVIAAAILDRLLHHSQVIATRGPSYRMKGRLARRVQPEEQSDILGHAPPGSLQGPDGDETEAR